MALRRQELHCHACDKYVQFNLDDELDGLHVLNCPNCGHEHCRVVNDGVISEERWDSRNTTKHVFTISSSSISYSDVSTWDTYTNSTDYSTRSFNTAGRYFIYDSWLSASSS